MRAMPSRGFTTNSLTAGGRWGRPAATGIEFDKSGNAVFKQEELDQMARDDEEAKFRNAKPFLYAPGGPGENPTPMATPIYKNQSFTKKPGSDLVHDANYIGARMGKAAQLFESEISAALDKYIANLQEAYTYNYQSGDNGVMQPVRALDLFSPGEIQPIVRQYLTVKKAARELIDVRTDQASIEAPFKRLSVEFNEGGKGDWGDGNCFRARRRAPSCAARCFQFCSASARLPLRASTTPGAGATTASSRRQSFGTATFGAGLRKGLPQHLVRAHARHRVWLLGQLWLLLRHVGA